MPDSHAHKYKFRNIALDREGFLLNLSDWSPQVAEQLAVANGIHLHDPHWEVIHLVREFYRQHDLSPPVRVIVKLLRNELGPGKGRSIYLMKLFGGSPGKIINKISGLPRPTNCF